MKKIILAIVFVLCTATIFAQYKMSIKKADNTTEDIWVQDITNITFMMFLSLVEPVQLLMRGKHITQCS